MELTLQELLEKIQKPFPEFEILPKKTILLLIDMQKLAGTEWLIEEAVEKGIPPDVAKKAVKDLDERIESVLKNSKKILKACRRKGIDRIHVKIESKFGNGRDVGRLHKLHKYIVPPGSVWAEFFARARANVIGIPGHSWQEVACCGMSIGHKSLIFAGKTIAGTALDLMTKPELLKKAQDEFRDRMKRMTYRSPIPDDVQPPLEVAKAAARARERL